jgi:hypothetical protein
LNHSFIVITFMLTQSDSFKRRALYYDSESVEESRETMYECPIPVGLLFIHTSEAGKQ